MGHVAGEQPAVHTSRATRGALHDSYLRSRQELGNMDRRTKQPECHKTKTRSRLDHVTELQPRDGRALTSLLSGRLRGKESGG